MTRKRVIKATLFTLITGLLLCLSPGMVAVSGAGIPQMPPNAFYGNVTINGDPAPVKTKVEVSGTNVRTGEAYNPIFTTEIGKYGTSGPTGDKLLAQGDIETGTTLSFRVKDTLTSQTATWEGGEKTRVDLSVTISGPVLGDGPGGGGPLSVLGTNLVCTPGYFLISGTGQIINTITCTSPDGKLKITLPSGTIARNRFGNPLSSFTVNVNPDPTCPIPEDERIIGLAYDFEPSGATFKPPIEIAYTYDSDEIKEGVLEEDLILAFCDEATGVWVPVPAIINTETNTITAQISHFTTFALIGKVPEVKPVPKPPPPPKPVPTPPAAFSPKSMSIVPSEVSPGGMVTISVTITNVGGEAGIHDVILKVNGVKEDSKTVSLSAGESKEVRFNISRDKAGIYQIECDGLPGSFEVISPPVPTPPAPTVPVEEPTNWWIWGGVIAAVIVAGLIIGLLMYRRRGEAKPQA